MTEHLRRDLDRLKRQLLLMGSMVEAATNKAIVALVDRRPDLAEEVMTGDRAIDEKEVEVEDECLKILALHQPVAGDLRFTIVALKVNNDLERMGDHSVNIAERAAFLATHEPLAVPAEFSRMAETVRAMARDSLDALVQYDTALARSVLQKDDDVDAVHRRMFATLQERMERDPKTIERSIHTLSASRQLERIADLATNIAEDVVFMVEGVVIRHAASRAAKAGAR